MAAERLASTTEPEPFRPKPPRATAANAAVMSITSIIQASPRRSSPVSQRSPTSASGSAACCSTSSTRSFWLPPYLARSASVRSAATTRPDASTSTRSQTRSTSDSMWVEKKMVVLPRNAVIRLSTSWRPIGSSAEVGSSRISNRGELIIA